MSNAVLYGLVFFAFAGTVMQWAWIWTLLKKVSALETKLYCELAKFPNQIPADHAKNAGYDSAPKV